MLNETIPEHITLLELVIVLHICYMEQCGESMRGCLNW